MGGQFRFPDDTKPYWISSTEELQYPALEQDLNVDIAIIGGGIVGITSAYYLTSAGYKVALVEADKILHGTTGHTTAKITSQHGLIYSEIKSQMGEEMAWQYATANENAIKNISQIIDEHQIDCDFSWRPAYIYTQSDDFVKQIEDETNLASSLGIKASYQNNLPLPFPVKLAMRFDDQAQFHPLKYLKALAQKVTARGNQIFEQTEAINLENPSNPTIVTRNGRKIKASKVIIASHFPFFDGGGLYFMKMFLEKSYVIATRIEETFPNGMFISLEDPARSLRSQLMEDGSEMVLFAGEHHKTGPKEDTNIHYQNLMEFANQNYELENILYRWSTQDCMTIDGVPYVGNLTVGSPNIYVATGFGKWGMSNGTAAATILTDLLTKGDSPYAQVYNPARLITSGSSFNTFVVQNTDVAKSFVTGKLAELAKDCELSKGEAEIIKFEEDRIGAYRDQEGNLHMVDTTCTHLGCELNWNNAEKTWDCPCHGSRFTHTGEIVEGPAINRLHHAEEEPNVVEARVFK